MSETEAFAHADGRQSEKAAAIARGTIRLLTSLDFASVMELTLANYRRADITALGAKGEIWIIEVKSCLADYAVDAKWPEYSDYCDQFFFAVDQEFPADVIPDETGLIIADRYGAEIVRRPDEHRLSGARRKAMTQRFARTAAQRLHGLIDPDVVSFKPS